MTHDLKDWTEGGEAILVHRCSACSHRWYFARTFCPQCGSTQFASNPSNGVGTVYSVTAVARAPSPELQQLAPYGIALIDLDEGIRVMTHATAGLGIGDRVRLQYLNFGGRMIPRACPLDTQKERGTA